ncbi:MAG TPA: OmpA family protein, partial [Sandaracinaceae bacterium]
RFAPGSIYDGRMTIRTILVGIALLAAGAGVAGCGGRDWQAENAALQADLEQARRDLQQAQARIDELSSENQELRSLLEARGADLSDMTALRERLQRELEAARAREARDRERLASLRAMARQFRDMIAAGQLRVRIVRGNMVVELPDNVLFDSGRAELRPAGQETLSRVAEVLARVPNRNFLVAGHTDNVPLGRRSRYASNWELSAARGVAVVRYLAEHGMSPERLAAAGYADTQPVASNDTEEGRAQNRRIEIIVLPNLDELPDLSSLEDELSSGGES